MSSIKVNTITPLSGNSITMTGTGIVSGSSQISYNGITDKPALVSGSAQVSFSGIVGKPALVSGSTQILNLVSIDEDTMSSNSDTKVPTQQSVKQYVDNKVSSLVDSAPGALDTLNELAAALNDDANFSTTVTNALAGKVSQSLQVISGNGLTGGGNLTTSRTLAVGAGDGISVSSDAVAVDGTVLRTTGFGVVSGSSQISFNGIVNKPTLVSGSSQISFSGITNKPTLVSGSAQISFNGIVNKPTLISGSSQVNADSITNFDSNVKDKLNADLVVSGSASDVKTFLSLQNVTNESKATMFSSPTFTGTVSGVTATHVGLGNVDNTSDANKPVSTAQQTALNAKLNINGAGVVSGSSQIDVTATTNYSTVSNHISNTSNPHSVTAAQVGLGNVTNESKATMFTSAALTGTPTAPTAPANTNSTQIATTAYVQQELTDLIGGAPAAFDTLLEISASLAAGDSNLNGLVDGKLSKASNLSDLTDTSAARTNIGLGNVTNESKATMFSSPTFTGTVSGVTATHVGLGNVTNESKATMFSSPTFTGTVSGVTKAHVGLSNVDNTSDASKPVSTATQTALNLKLNASAVSTFGGTLIDDADAATARTTLGLGALATLSSVNSATIADGSVGAAELCVSGNGTTSQFLRSAGNGSFTWATPPSSPSTHVYAGTSNTSLRPVSGSNTVSNYFSTVGGGQSNTASGATNGGCATVAGGCGNQALGNFSFVGGGRNNRACCANSIVVGGGGSMFFNSATGDYAAIVGGEAQTASIGHSFIGGGSFNTASGYQSTVAGGFFNTASGYAGGGCATVAGGRGNQASANFSTIAGGFNNSASGYGSVVAGGGGCGAGNSASGPSSFVGGGRANSASGCHSTVGGGTNNSASGNGRTVVAGGCANTASGYGAAILGGRLSCATGDYSIVLGGSGNNACNTFSIVAGGTCNTASGYLSTISGGAGNMATGCCSTIGGGVFNSTSLASSVGHFATISGGACHIASGCFSTVGGGGTIVSGNTVGNTASGEQSTISGGGANCAPGCQSTIGGGTQHMAAGTQSTVSGGYHNYSMGVAAFVGGGQYNTANGAIYPTVAGGLGNTASAYYATVGGGCGNTASGYYSLGYLQYVGAPTIAGGKSNTASHRYTFVGGGFNNTASAAYATVGGGCFNRAQEFYSTVVGGYFNTTSASYSTIAGGSMNTANGYHSTVSGGFANSNTGCYSVIAGGLFNCINCAQSGILGGADNTVSHNCSFIIGSNLTSTAACYTFVNNLCNVGGGTSDRRLKENIKPIPYGINELSRLQPVCYNFIDDESKKTKYGFIAQCVQEVMPDLIYHHPTDTVEGTPVLQFDKEAVWASMVNAIKELKQRVEELESKVN